MSRRLRIAHGSTVNRQPIDLEKRLLEGVGRRQLSRQAADLVNPTWVDPLPNKKRLYDLLCRLLQVIGGLPWNRRQK